MARCDAKKERWEPMKIRGVSGYFCDVRIERDTVPEQFRMWEVADIDSSGIPCRYRKGILVNFFGTFITTGELPIDDYEFEEGYINSGDDYNFTGEQSLIWEEVMGLTENGKVM